MCDFGAVAQVKDAEGKAVQPFLYKLSPDDEALSSAQLLALYQVLPARLQTPFAGLRTASGNPTLRLLVELRGHRSRGGLFLCTGAR